MFVEGLLMVRLVSVLMSRSRPGLIPHCSTATNQKSSLWSQNNKLELEVTEAFHHWSLRDEADISCVPFSLRELKETEKKENSLDGRSAPGPVRKRERDCLFCCLMSQTPHVNHQWSGEANESLVSACRFWFIPGNKAIFMHINILNAVFVHFFTLQWLKVISANCRHIFVSLSSTSEVCLVPLSQRRQTSVQHW